MSYAPHMELITELMPLLRRDFETALDLNPDTTEPVVDGEWLELNASYTLIRGSGERLVPCFPVFAERGRYDTQAIGKLPVIFGGMYEFDTDLVNSGHGITLVTCFQDLAQVTARWGERTGTLVNNHRTRVILGGLADPTAAELVVGLAGVRRDRMGGDSPGVLERPLVAAHELRQMPLRSGLVISGSVPVARLRLRPWWQHRGLAERGRTR